MKAVNHYLIIDMIKEEPTNVGGLILTEETDNENISMPKISGLLKFDNVDFNFIK